MEKKGWVVTKVGDKHTTYFKGMVNHLGQKQGIGLMIELKGWSGDAVRRSISSDTLGDLSVTLYEGEWRRGLMDGYGRIIDKDGEEYFTGYRV